MKLVIAAVLLIFVQSAAAHRDVSDLIKERQEIKQLMLKNLFSIKAALNTNTSSTQPVIEQALYLSKATEFSATLFAEISEHSAPFSELFRQLIAQTARAYELSLKNNERQLSSQIQLITNTCNHCHSLRSLPAIGSHKND